MKPTPSSGLKMHQPSIVEGWKKTFVATDETVNTSRQPVMRGTIENKTGTKFGQGGVEPISDIRKHIDTLKRTEEENKKTEETQV